MKPHKYWELLIQEQTVVLSEENILEEFYEFFNKQYFESEHGWLKKEEALKLIIDYFQGKPLDFDFLKEVEKEGYFNIRYVPHAGYCGLHRYIYTIGICIGLNTVGFNERFCFDSLLGAKSFLDTWDGETNPVVGQDGCTAIK